jgi:hypothetical protein
VPLEETGRSAAAQAPQQIFISYARDDDEPPPDQPDAEGFVTHLHKQLLYELRQLGQPRPQLWRDTKRIDRGEQFERELCDAVAGSSLLVVVLSRNWIDRDWCRRELELFTKQFPHEDERSLRERIVIVRKNEVDPAAHPKVLQGQEGFRLYGVDPENGEEMHFFARGKVVPKWESRYHDELERLAHCLWSRAQAKEPSKMDGARLPASPGREAEAAADPTSPVSGQRAVFVSKPATDMIQAYDTLVRELGNRGYRVVPDPGVNLPYTSEATEIIDQALAAAEFSVHLVGKQGGFAPEGAAPIVQLQLERAGARVGSTVSEDETDPRRFHRIIWAPRTLPDLGIADRNPGEVVARLCGHLETDKVLGDTLVTFGQYLIDHLEKTTPRPSRPPASLGEGACIYIEHLEADSAYADDLAESLQQAGLNVSLPAFDGDEADRLRLHQQYLANCDAVVLCWASASEVWIRSNAAELKWDRLGRKSPFQFRGVVAGPPPQQPKNRFRKIPPRTDIDLVIDATDVNSPAPELLQPLLRSLSSHAK